MGHLWCKQTLGENLLIEVFLPLLLLGTLQLAWEESAFLGGIPVGMRREASPDQNDHKQTHSEPELSE